MNSAFIKEHTRARALSLSLSHSLSLSLSLFDGDIPTLFSF